MTPLPIDELLPEIRTSLARHRHAVIVSPPGSGKTTRVPPALIEDGNVILLQPRRVAARSLARRIATEQRWTLGDTVGWQMRLDRNFSRATKLLICTEGILTARLQSDPLLSGFRTVVLDEFHERSIYADLALAMLREASEARDDLRIVVMSATIDPAPIRRFLGGESKCSTIEGGGGLHPVEVVYRPGRGIADAVVEATEKARGDVLVFLPGVREIEQARSEIMARRVEADTVALHGRLSPAEQDRAILAGPRRKVILSTNIAETSLTVEGIEAVIDSGFHKVLRYDDSSGIDRLVTERIPRDAADQRSGRAGRLGPGLAIRLWDERDLLREQREPEVHRIDLSPTMLDILQWGSDPYSFEWYDAPAGERIEKSLDLLRSMDAVARPESSAEAERLRLTATGDLMQRLALSPRLARILIEAKGSEPARRACTAIAEGQIRGIRGESASASDLLHLSDQDQSRHLVRSSEQLRSVLTASGLAIDDSQDEDAFLRSILAGFPDRVARRRAGTDGRYQLASGQGAVLSERSSVRTSEWIVAVEVSRGDGGREAMIHLASAIDPSWLSPTKIEAVHEYDENADRVRARLVMRYGEITLSEQQASPDPAEVARILVSAFLRRPLSEENELLIDRAKFAGVDIDLAGVAESALAGKSSIGTVRIEDWLPWDDRKAIDREAPARIDIPSGRSVLLDYRKDGSVVASAKLQELFGLEDSPRIGRRRVPVTFELLAPNGRPVQTTSDLRNFWETTYPEVRRELRGRYAKHPWPEDPWSATATSRTKKQMESDRSGRER